MTFDILFWKKTKVKCTMCGRIIAEKEVFCRYCGAKQTDTPDTIKTDVESMIKRLLVKYQSVIKNHLPEASLRFQLGVIYKLKGMLDEAFDEFKAASSIDKANVEYYIAIGGIQAQRKRYAEAIESFRQAVSIHPEYPDLHNNVGVAYFKTGEVDNAIVEFKKAIEINQKYANAHNNLGIAYRKKGMKESSDAEFKKAQELDSDHVMADYELGRAYYSGGMFDEGQALKDIDAKMIGDLCFSAGMYDEAVNQYQMALQKNQNYADLHCRLGRAYSELGDKEKARIEFQKALEINPGYQEAKTYLHIT